MESDNTDFPQRPPNSPFFWQTPRTPARRSAFGATVSEIPLFPLDLVLFPGMVLPLHIFEERYREMVNRCVDDDICFGVVLVARNAAGKPVAPEDVATYETGCTARVTNIHRFPDGRLNIEIEGERRFRLLDTHENQPYRSGLVEFFDDAPGEPLGLATLAGETNRLLREFLTRSLAILGQRIAGFNLPNDPALLSFTTACVLPVEDEQKQALLEETDTSQRLVIEREILAGEITKLRRAMEASEMVWTPIRADWLQSYQSAN